MASAQPNTARRIAEGEGVKKLVLGISRYRPRDSDGNPKLSEPYRCSVTLVEKQEQTEDRQGLLTQDVGCAPQVFEALAGLDFGRTGVLVLVEVGKRKFGQEVSDFVVACEVLGVAK